MRREARTKPLTLRFVEVWWKGRETRWVQGDDREVR